MLSRLRSFACASLVILWVTSSSAQQNFMWDEIDTIPLSKNEIYSGTKLFIAETWKSAKVVIDNDDKEGGIILLKGVSVQELTYQLNQHIWTYSYVVKFMMKEGRCRVIIDNVRCDDVRVGSDFSGTWNYNWPLMPVSDVYPSQKALKITGVNEERYALLMHSLKRELQLVVDAYPVFLQAHKRDDEW